MNKSKPFQDIFTPDIMIQELVDHMDIQPDSTILEPSAGDGNMIKFLVERYDNLDIIAVEIQLDHAMRMRDRLSELDNTKVSLQKLKSVFDCFF